MTRVNNRHLNKGSVWCWSSPGLSLTICLISSLTLDWPICWWTSSLSLSSLSLFISHLWLHILSLSLLCTSWPECCPSFIIGPHPPSLTPPSRNQIVHFLCACQFSHPQSITAVGACACLCIFPLRRSERSSNWHPFRAARLAFISWAGANGERNRKTWKSGGVQAEIKEKQQRNLAVCPRVYFVLTKVLPRAHSLFVRAEEELSY